LLRERELSTLVGGEKQKGAAEIGKQGTQNTDWKSCLD
jgi:hypothetical protein